MHTECSADLFGFAPVERRAVVAGFDGGRMSSDAGALLLSFPNNHCLQSFLVAHCLEAVTPQDGGHSIYRHQLNWLARRIAVNRERAGLHYPSDTEGGRFLARHLFDNYLSQWPALSTGGPSRFTQLLAAARGEWP